MDKINFLKKMDILLNEGLQLTNKSTPLKNFQPINMNLQLYTECHTWYLKSLNLVRLYVGPEHTFYKNLKSCHGNWFNHVDKEVKQPIEYCKEDMVKTYATLSYIRNEVNEGMIEDIQHLYEANLFSNLLEQAFALSENNYLVGATVYSRLIIENFINDLCRLKEITLEKNEKLPSKLTKLRKKEIINLPLERVIQSAYDVGTFAVHGESEFNKYTKEMIIEHLKTVRDKILTIK